MKTLKELCTPRKSVFDPQKRDTVLDLADLVGKRINPDEFFEENWTTEGMKTLLDHKAGRTPPRRVGLPPTLVTRENLNDPNVQKLLNPELDRYLKEEKRP